MGRKGGGSQGEEEGEEGGRSEAKGIDSDEALVYHHEGGGPGSFLVGEAGSWSVLEAGSKRRVGRRKGYPVRKRRVQRREWGLGSKESRVALCFDSYRRRWLAGGSDSGECGSRGSSAKE